MRHPLTVLSCSLLAEVHATLIYNLRTVPFTRHNAILSLIPMKDKLEPVHGVSVAQLTGDIADVGNNWERAPLRHAEGREGWEESMVGCLKDVCILVLVVAVNTEQRLSSMRHLRTFLVFARFSLNSYSPRTSLPTPRARLHQHLARVLFPCVFRRPRLQDSSTTSCHPRTASLSSPSCAIWLFPAKLSMLT